MPVDVDSCDVSVESCGGDKEVAGSVVGMVSSAVVGVEVAIASSTGLSFFSGEEDVTGVITSQKIVPREESSIMRPFGAVAVGGVIMARGRSTGYGLGVGFSDVLSFGRISVFAAASSSPIAEDIFA